MRDLDNPFADSPDEFMLAKAISVMARSRSTAQSLQRRPRSRRDLEQHIHEMRRRIEEGTDPDLGIFGLSLAGMRAYFERGGFAETHGDADLMANACASLIRDYNA